MDKLPERQKLQSSLKKIYIKQIVSYQLKIKFIVKNFPKKKTSGPDGFTNKYH